MIKHDKRDYNINKSLDSPLHMWACLMTPVAPARSLNLIGHRAQKTGQGHRKKCTLFTLLDNILHYVKKSSYSP